ncbi:MAG: hypothetical protein GF365_03990 [Candidatus Buchananbacteria bacterium]|nr:hypothetical protein [Candidatus Buchananbacteria bacterium]
MGLFDSFLRFWTGIFDDPVAEKIKMDRLVNHGERAIADAMAEKWAKDAQSRLGPSIDVGAEVNVTGLLHRPSLDDCKDKESRIKFGLKMAKQFQGFNQSAGNTTIGNSSLDISDLIDQGERKLSTFQPTEPELPSVPFRMRWNLETGKQEIVLDEEDDTPDLNDPLFYYKLMQKKKK